MSNQLKVVLGIILMSVLIGSISTIFKTQEVQGQTTGPATQACTASTSKVTIGHQLSTQVLATSSRRAWARVQVDQNATNTVALALNDVTATLNNGILINQALINGVSTTPILDLGLNTALPYTGSIKAITNLGSTTLLVTQCIY